MEKILATGGAGYIGSQCVHELCASGFSTIVFDNLSNGYPAFLPDGVEVVIGDVRDTDLLYRTLVSHSIDTIIHFAGLISAPDSFLTPERYYDVNTNGLLQVVKAAQLARVRRIIFSSTAAVYKEAVGLISETFPIEAKSPYGRSKYMAEVILQDAALSSGFDYTILRYFNVAGADPDLKTGQCNAKTDHIFKVALDVAAGSKDFIQINGHDYKTKDGTCVRDFVHVKDLATAHVNALQWMMAGGRNEVFNCGYGRGYSVLEVMKSIERAAGVALTSRLGERRRGDLAEVVADASKCRAVLGWMPKYQEIEEMAAHAWRWRRHVANLPTGSPTLDTPAA